MNAPSNTYPDLFWGYLVVWGLLTVYLIMLGIRCSKLEKKLPQQTTNSSDSEK